MAAALDPFGVLENVLSLMDRIHTVVENVKNAPPSAQRLNERCQRLHSILVRLRERPSFWQRHAEQLLQQHLKPLEVTLQKCQAFLDDFFQYSFVGRVLGQGRIHVQLQTLVVELNEARNDLILCLVTLDDQDHKAQHKPNAKNEWKTSSLQPDDTQALALKAVTESFAERYLSDDYHQELKRIEAHYKDSEHTTLEAWAQAVYIKFHATDGTDATVKQINRSRRLCLQLAYDVVDVWYEQYQYSPEFQVELARAFKHQWWIRLLQPCLALDRAHALYQLTPLGAVKAPVGVDWYALQHVDTKSPQTQSYIGQEGYFATAQEQQEWIAHLNAFQVQYPLAQPPLNWRLFCLLFAAPRLKLDKLRHWATPVRVSSVRGADDNNETAATTMSEADLHAQNRQLITVKDQLTQEILSLRKQLQAKTLECEEWQTKWTNHHTMTTTAAAAQQATTAPKPKLSPPRGGGRRHHHHQGEVLVVTDQLK